MFDQNGSIPQMIDSHFHWLPAAVEDELNSIRGVSFRHAPEWTDLDAQLAALDATGRDIGVVCSAGVAAAHFTEVSAEAGRDTARRYNEEMAQAQRAHPGRVWAAGVAPLQDADLAIAELDHAIITLGLVGISVPGSIGASGMIDEPRLEPFYDRVEELGAVILLHPTDLFFKPILGGYNGALHLSLGRVIDLSVVAYRLVLSGIMERHPTLKVFLTHTGGALPYQAGRMDKNSKAAGLPEPPSAYLKRMYTDTVSPHPMGVRFAIDFYGAEHVMYGDDYPCWNPRAALDILDGIDLSEADRRLVRGDNARRLFNLRVPPSTVAQRPSDELMPAASPAARGTGLDG